MPVINASSYKAHPFFFKNGHIETIIPSVFGSVDGIRYKRERIHTPDDDFLDLDWLKTGNNRLIILSHGLEGSSDRTYMKSMAKYFNQRNWDVLAWNYRSCSGEMNRALRLYHHGVTDDYHTVLQHVLKATHYHKIVLSGFSMGGSTTLKYLGEQGSNIDSRVKATAVFSVPCNLWSSALELKKPGNKFYTRRFIKKMINKIKAKAALYPDKINIDGIDNIKTFDEFDERYTAPLHGFKDPEDFYTSSTSDQFYDNIKIPALIVNALNDPMLGEKCYPYRQAQDLEHLYLETPNYGGHVGFALQGKAHNWMDERAWEFFEKQLS